MKKHLYFPETAFAPKSRAQRMGHLFMAKVYRPEDIHAIRGSLHFYNPRKDSDGEQIHDMAFVQACRLADGSFRVHVMRVDAFADRPQKWAAIINKPANSDPSFICGEKDVIQKMRAVERELAASAAYSTAYRARDPDSHKNALHIDIAARIFSGQERITDDEIADDINHALNRDQIVYRPTDSGSCRL